MKKLKLACLLASLFLFSTLSIADTSSLEDPWLLLEKAAKASRELSYKGVFTHQNASHMRSIDITHVNAGQGEYSRAISLDGSPMEVLRQGQDMVIFNPKGEKVIIQKRRGHVLFPALLPANMDLIKSFYGSKIVGEERVAGRDGFIIELEPKDQYRYSYRLWADKEFGLLLKATTVNRQGQVVDQIAFSQVNLVNQQGLDWFQPKIDQRKPYVMEDQTGVVAEPASPTSEWQIQQVPAGYRLVDHIKRMIPTKYDAKRSMAVHQLIFSDGLASVSLFIEHIDHNTKPKYGHTSSGSTSFYANVYDGHQIIAVGEVPEATVTQFANAVTFKK